MNSFKVKGVKGIFGEILVPGDKSISHRSIILGSIAKGVTCVQGFLSGEDSLATLYAFRDMGVDISRDGNNLIIKGAGMFGLKQAKKALNLGNSGTAMRLMTGLLSAQNFTSQLIGDNSLSSRPMGRVITPLSVMGADIISNNGMPPLTIKPSNSLLAINYKMPIASAQVKSAILLAALYAQGDTVVEEIAPSRDHTERMLSGFGYNIKTNANKICLTGGGELIATDVKVPADISSAAFFMVAASIADKADIVLKSVNINPTRTGIIDILLLMGANITLSNKQELGGELLADICVKSAPLKGIRIPSSLVPLAIDEFPVIFVAAACAKGQTTLRDAKELRVKESDRITTMADGLDILGIKTQVLDDGIIIDGGEFKQPSNIIDSYGDHRIAMAFSVASLRCKYTINISNCANVSTSFPNFVQIANQVGMDIDCY